MTTQWADHHDLDDFDRPSAGTQDVFISRRRVSGVIGEPDPGRRCIPRPDAPGSSRSLENLLIVHQLSAVTLAAVPERERHPQAFDGACHELRPGEIRLALREPVGGEPIRCDDVITVAEFEKNSLLSPFVHIKVEGHAT